MTVAPTPFQHLRSASRSDVGLRRKQNEDARLEIPRHGVFVVADGMGGGEEGEFASRTLVEAVADAFSSDQVPKGGPLSLDSKADRVRLACNDASRKIQSRLREIGAKQMGTTVVALLLDAADPARAVVLHAGDSRIYRLRGKELGLFTRDHSVTEAVGGGKDSEVPAMFRGMLTRAVGLSRAVDLERSEFEVGEDDWIILCSDGLSHMVPDAGIRKVALQHADQSPEAMVDALIGVALSAGGKDNVTVTAVQVGKLPAPAATVEDMVPLEEEATATPTEMSSFDSEFETTDPGAETDDRAGALPRREPPTDPGFSSGGHPDTDPEWLRFLRARKWGVPWFPVWSGGVGSFLLVGLLLLTGGGENDPSNLVESIAPPGESVPAVPAPASVPESFALVPDLVPNDQDPTEVMAWVFKDSEDSWQPLANAGQPFRGSGRYRVRFERAGYLPQEREVDLSFEDQGVKPEPWIPGTALGSLQSLEEKVGDSGPLSEEERTRVTELAEHEWQSEFHEARAQGLASRVDGEQKPAKAHRLRFVGPNSSSGYAIFLVDASGEETPLELEKISGDGTLDVPQDAKAVAFRRPGYLEDSVRLEFSEELEAEVRLPDEGDWIQKPWLLALEGAEEAMKAGDLDHAKSMMQDLSPRFSGDETSYRERWRDLAQQVETLEKDELVGGGADEDLARPPQESSGLAREVDDFLLLLKSAENYLDGENWREAKKLIKASVAPPADVDGEYVSRWDAVADGVAQRELDELARGARERGDWSEVSAYLKTESRVKIHHLPDDAQFWTRVWRDSEASGWGSVKSMEAMDQSLEQWELLLELPPPDPMVEGAGSPEGVANAIRQLDARLVGVQDALALWLEKAVLAHDLVAVDPAAHRNYLAVWKATGWEDKRPPPSVAKFEEIAGKCLRPIEFLAEERVLQNRLLSGNGPSEEEREAFEALGDFWSGHQNLLRNVNWLHMDQRMHYLRTDRYRSQGVFAPDRETLEEVKERLSEHATSESREPDWIVEVIRLYRPPANGTPDG